MELNGSRMLAIGTILYLVVISNTVQSFAARNYGQKRRQNIQQRVQNLSEQNDRENDEVPATTTLMPFESDITTFSSDENITTTPTPDLAFERNRNIAIHNVLRRVLQALGPKFKNGLPIAPTNATLTPFNSTIKVVGSETCPDYYKRCSSQTFYPSCEIPRNTDKTMWDQRFTLYFNISSDISSINRLDILNATLRLYKNLSLPLSTPNTLIVRLHAFIRSLKRNREKSRIISSTRVSSDYVGWVFLDVYRLIKRLKGPNNYGIKISVTNENDIPWNIPDLFVKMDCQASNETLIPLPFEVMQLGNDTQRYPALNIRSGSQESVEDSDYYTNEDYSPNTNNFNVANSRPHAPRGNGRQERPFNSFYSNGPGNFRNQGGGNPYYSNYHGSRGGHNSINQNGEENPSYYGDEMSEDRYNDYFEGPSPDIWSTNDGHFDQHHRQPSALANRKLHRSKYNEQTTPYPFHFTPQYFQQRMPSHNSQINGVFDDYSSTTDYNNEYSSLEERERQHPRRLIINNSNRNQENNNDTQENEITTSTVKTVEIVNDPVEAPPLGIINDEPYSLPSRIMNVSRRHHSQRRLHRRHHHRHHPRRHHYRNQNQSLPIDPIPT